MFSRPADHRDHDRVYAGLGVRARRLEVNREVGADVVEIPDNLSCDTH